MDNGVLNRYRRTLYGNNRWMSYAKFEEGCYNELLDLIKKISIKKYEGIKSLFANFK